MTSPAHRFPLSLALAVAFACGQPLPAAAAERAVSLEEARSLIGQPVTTADGVPLGHLVATRPGPEGDVICIVRLDERLSRGTSPLQFVGLRRDAGGGLRVADGSAALNRSIGLRF
jgi:hypothetical protein